MLINRITGADQLADRPLLFATGELIPLRGLEGVPGLHGAPQDEAGLARTFLDFDTID